ncbi:hypothetical protein ACVJMY_008790 [Bradyrhizobium diazoefficiens]
MSHSDFQLRGVGDPRLAVHATSPLPVWLWSVDGARVLWANPVGAKFFGAAHAAVLAEKTFGPADSHRRQVARLARQLPASGTVRLERLRGFGARLGTLMTCACTRLTFADGGQAVLVTAMDPSVRTMPLIERLHRLVAGAKMPMAAFAPDGMFVGASEAARALLGFRDLGEAGLEQARSDALRSGRAETPIGIGQMVLQRVGLGADIGLVALIEPAAAQAAAASDAAPAASAPASTPDVTPAAPAQSTPQAAEAPNEAPPSNEAPAAIAMFDAFAEPVETPAAAEAIAAALPVSEAAPEIATVQETVEEAVAETVEEAAQESAEEPADAPKTPVENHSSAIVSPQAAPITTGMVEPPSGPAETPAPHQHPLRFLWQMDAEGRFVLASCEFIRLMGAHTAAGFGRPWREIAEEFSLDPEGRVAQALASHDTWAGITVNWPADGGEHLPVELAGLPVYDHARNFVGFKGFGVCRDLDGLNRLDALRRFELLAEPPAQHGLSADIAEPDPEPVAEAPPPAEPPAPEPEPAPEAELPAPALDANSHPTDPETPVETPPNVVPFRPPGDTRSPGDQRSPTLTPIENSAFNELARQLSERLERERETIATATTEPPAESTPEPLIEAPPHAPGRMADRAGAAGARPQHARPRAARPLTDRHPDLSARPPALRQPGVPRAHGPCQRERAGQCRRPRCALCRAGRIARQQHLARRHAGYDQRDASQRRRAASDHRGASAHDRLGRRERACAGLRAAGCCACRCRACGRAVRRRRACCH